MISLPPWAIGPFELLVHAEEHRLRGEDFDRRIALISFDNAIEVTITTYLTLHPIQRGNREYKREDVERWLDNYYTKLDFLEEELIARNLTWEVEKSYIIWAHAHRNEQYHGGRKGTPEKHVLDLIRKAALWVFSVLYDVPDVEKLLGQRMIEILPPAPPQRDSMYDRAIDNEFGMINLGQYAYYASELLFAVDYDAYRDVGGRLIARQHDHGSEDQEEKE